jgi:hypothetical protein
MGLEQWGAHMRSHFKDGEYWMCANRETGAMQSRWRCATRECRGVALVSFRACGLPIESETKSTIGAHMYDLTFAAS